MTNRERLNAMSNEDYKLEADMYAACTVRKHVDYEAWLNSEDEEYPILGKEAKFKDTGDELRDCWFIKNIEMNGAPFAEIIVKEPMLHAFKTIKVPQDAVIVN